MALYKRQPGENLKLGVARSRDTDLGGGLAGWELFLSTELIQPGDRLYAKVNKKVLENGDLCLAARSCTGIYPSSPPDDLPDGFCQPPAVVEAPEVARPRALARLRAGADWAND